MKRLLVLVTLLVPSIALAKSTAKASATCSTDDDKSIGKPRKIDKPIRCSINIAKIEGDATELSLIVWTTGTAGAKPKTTQPDPSAKFGVFQPLEPGTDFKTCVDFTIRLQLVGDGEVIWQKDVPVKQACPKPPPIKADLSCFYETSDGKMFKWPGNGAKTKIRLSRTVSCMVVAKKVPADAKLTAFLKLKGKDKAPQSQPTHETGGGSETADGTFSPEEGDFDECENITVEGWLQDAEGAKRWSGSLAIKQFCPD